MNNKLYEIFESELIARKPTKAVETKIRIIEATIEYLGVENVTNITYLKIAECAGLSKQLIQKYFPKKDELFYLVFVYIRTSYQIYVVEQVKKQRTAEDQLTTYIRYALVWALERRSHAVVWTLLWNFAAKDKKFANLYNSFEIAGQERIAVLLTAYLLENSLPLPEMKQRAAVLQRYLIGSIVHLALAEDSGSRESFVEDLISQSLQLIKSDLIL